MMHSWSLFNSYKLYLLLDTSRSHQIWSLQLLLDSSLTPELFLYLDMTPGLLMDPAMTLEPFLDPAMTPGLFLDPVMTSGLFLDPAMTPRPCHDYCVNLNCHLRWPLPLHSILSHTGHQGTCANFVNVWNVCISGQSNLDILPTDL